MNFNRAYCAYENTWIYGPDETAQDRAREYLAKLTDEQLTQALSDTRTGETLLDRSDIKEEIEIRKESALFDRDDRPPI